MTTDAKILSALRENADGVSGAELAEQLKISRAAVWARIEELRQVGFDISASPHFGYRIVGEPDALLADDLLARLNCCGWGERPREPQSSKSKRLAGTLAPPRSRVIGRDIRVFQETTSTNDIIERFARDGVKEGVVVFAESQTRG